MYRRRTTSIWLSAIAVSVPTLMPVSSADASLIAYSDRAAFLAAVGQDRVVVDFEGLGGQTFQTLNSTVNPAIPDGVSFRTLILSPTELFVAPPNFMGNAAITTDSLMANRWEAPLQASIAPSVTAVAADVIAYTGDGGTAPIWVVVNSPPPPYGYFYVTPPAGSAAFFGLIATDGEVISIISFAPPPGFTVAVDNFLLGNRLPEPTSFGLGVAALWLSVVKRRNL